MFHPTPIFRNQGLYELWKQPPVLNKKDHFHSFLRNSAINFAKLSEKKAITLFNTLIGLNRKSNTKNEIIFSSLYSNWSCKRYKSYLFQHIKIRFSRTSYFCIQLRLYPFDLYFWPWFLTKPDENPFNKSSEIPGK